MQRRKDKRKGEQERGRVRGPAHFPELVASGGLEMQGGLFLRTAPQFGNLCSRDRPPPLCIAPQIEYGLHAFHSVLDHRLRPGAVHDEAQEAEVRFCPHLFVGNDSQGLTEPRWRDTRLQQVI